MSMTPPGREPIAGVGPPLHEHATPVVGDQDGTARDEAVGRGRGGIVVVVASPAHWATPRNIDIHTLWLTRPR